MTGKVLRVGTVPHSCRPPDILKFGAPGPSGVPSVTVSFPAGSAWQCDCGSIWHAVYEGPHTIGTMRFAGGTKWRPETRRERRRRLGLPWWRSR